jgi:hypothetical protein
VDSLRIIDTVGPFAVGNGKHILNWSKNPFGNLEQKDSLDKKKCKEVLTSFDDYLQKVTTLGYNAITIDDLPHLIIHDFYTTPLKKLLSEYQRLYKQLFAIANKYNLKIYVNVDYMYYNNDIDNHTNGKYKQIEKLFFATVEHALQQYPEITGINIRIGESDAKDIQDNFISRLTLKTPKQVNRFLKGVLPLFEKHKKTLIFRTWTVGVYKIGDLMWNKKTFDTIFSSIKSENLVISMKYGDTDFLRYLSLNPLFFRGKHKKIVEFQTKREWEGMGLYPSFVGWDYEQYLKQLRTNKQFIGISVWCQTGGWTWSSWKNLTFLENSSFWNELNTYVTVKIYSEKISVAKAIAGFCKEKRIQDSKAFIQLLKHSEIAIKNGLYIKEFASKAVYFRRLRIPPLTWIVWDKILVNPLTKSFLLHTVKDRERAIKEGFIAIDAINQMLALGIHMRLDKSIIHSLEFELETFTILAQVRKVLFSSLSEEEKATIKRQIATYEKKYPEHYTASISVWKQKIRRTRKATIALYLTLRSKMTYRIIDRISLLITPIQKYFIKQYVKRVAPFLSSQAMGIDVLFK